MPLTCPHKLYHFRSFLCRALFEWVEKSSESEPNNLEIGIAVNRKPSAHSLSWNLNEEETNAMAKHYFLRKIFFYSRNFFPENSRKNFSLKKPPLHPFITFTTFITFCHCHLKIFFGEKIPCTKNTSRKQTCEQNKYMDLWIYGISDCDYPRWLNGPLSESAFWPRDWCSEKRAPKRISLKLKFKNR